MKKTTEWEAQVSEALESAKQIKSWNKYGRCDLSYLNVWLMGLLIGLVIGMIVITPTIISACN